MGRGRQLMGTSILAMMLMTTPTAVQAELPLPLPILKPVAWQAISGWPGKRLDRSLAAFQRSCRDILNTARGFRRASSFGGEPENWHAACRKALATHPSEARAYFEQVFYAYRVVDPTNSSGLFTGYFEPVYPGSRTPTPAYPVPVYGRPTDLVAFDAAAEAQTGLRYGRIVLGRPEAYPTRRDIAAGVLAGKSLEIAWMASPVDAYFMHVQGSARLRLPNGSFMRLAYSGKSGRPYTSIGRLLAERKILPRNDVNMESIRAWLAVHPKAAYELMVENESFVFFREVPIGDPALGPPGGELVGLSPRVSLAVDRRYWTYGTPLWLDTVVPDAGRTKPFRKLMIAQDTGSAIRGSVRGDIFFGSGDAAGIPAGRMQAPGDLIVLLPRALVRHLGLAKP